MNIEAETVTGEGQVSAGFPPGSQVLVRDEQWLVRKSTFTRRDRWMIEVTGVSPFVRGEEAIFYQSLDDIRILDPRETKLVADDSANHRRARLFLEAVFRKSALPQTEHGLALADGFLMHPQVHQLRPAELALSMKNPQPRILIADVVGLGKTLEIGILLAELIRRGRGERILVVTPQHILEQFQREMWTRFAIPLVRLDSTGIQRVQREIPAGRNPFAYFKRAIISVDTLKSAVYAHHLEQTDWDAVVIDESHNLVNRGTQNNELARLLARKTDALILASATPHNGRAESFAELIHMLDEAAIADPSNYDVDQLEHLYIRRTKTSPEVRDSLTGSWPDRGPSTAVHVQASAAETAVFAELIERWIPAEGGPSVSTHQLVPYQLLKSFLSSHRALLATIRTRLKTLATSLAEKPGDQARLAERTALLTLQELTGHIQDDDASKLTALVAQLRELGVGPGSDTRVVIFSERIPTLTWLAQTVPAVLGFPATAEVTDRKPWTAFNGAVQVMHRESTSDEEQQRIVEAFGLRDAPVRMLFTGDLASEGVNLHQQCHILIHYDLPWSLIRIEQRNGRIDRYGQKHSPQFRALVLTSNLPWRTDPESGAARTLDDRLVGEKLLAREAEAHKIEGSAEAVTGLYRAQEEEDRLIKDLVAGRTVEQSIKKSRAGRTGFLAKLVGQVGAVPERKEVLRAEVLTLFSSTADYFDEGLRQICRPNPEDQLSLYRDDNGTIAFEPPADLLYRLRSLPRSYLKEQQILPGPDSPGRLRITFSKDLADARLTAARESSDSQWPTVSYVTDVHPVLDWLTDKVLVEVGRHEAPVLAAAVTEPVFLVQGIASNRLGRPTIVKWMAATGLPNDPRTVEITPELLAEFGLGPRMPARAVPRDLDGLTKMVPDAIEEARRYFGEIEGGYRADIKRTLEPYRDKVGKWKQAALFAGPRPDHRQVDSTADRLIQLVASLESVGAPMLRLLAVLEPLADGVKGAQG
ncbi:DEAD/DEAH box helicase [Micromonospora inaquosa]|uniref:DEAD/DEAH box helicase n=1 Tax=Micromonospora inaquosa TaxID=2203716 RepID=UPI001FC94E4E|nr:DEAD/DEAH box helicase [Micromonospora inaquosa]